MSLDKRYRGEVKELSDEADATCTCLSGQGKDAASDCQGFGAERWDGDKSHPPCGDEAGTLLLIARVSAQSAGTGVQARRTTASPCCASGYTVLLDSSG